MKALLIIDIQNGLTKKKKLYNESVFIESVNTTIRSFREQGSIIIFIQHNNKFLIKGTIDWEIDERLERHNEDCTVQKEHGNAFQNTDLKNVLTELSVHSITICGLVSHGCVRATALGGMKEGFEVILLKNGHTNWNKNAEEKIRQIEKELSTTGVKMK